MQSSVQKLDSSEGREVFLYMNSLHRYYRASHMLVDLGWVQLVSLPICPAASAKFPSTQTELGRRWNNSKSTKPSPRADGTPCTATNASSFLQVLLQLRRRLRFIAAIGHPGPALSDRLHSALWRNVPARHRKEEEEEVSEYEGCLSALEMVHSEPGGEL